MAWLKLYNLNGQSHVLATKKVNLLIKITHCVFPAWLERDVKILLLKHYNQWTQSLEQGKGVHMPKPLETILYFPLSSYKLSAKFYATQAHIFHY